jgi:DNA (cytosine-5)-methyltransferase 1
VSEFTFVDLFAGIGGFRSALTAAGGNHVYANEWNKFARLTYSEWYGSDSLDGSDIRLVDPNSIPSHNVLAAGFPCQPFSIAGVSKKNSLNRPHGFEDPDQGNLFFALARIIEAKRPEVFILENVKNLMSHDKGNTWQTISLTLKDLGYTVFCKVLSSESLVPQKRQRVFIVGFDSSKFDPEETEYHFQYPLLDGPALTLSKILSNSPDKKYMLSEKLWDYLQGYRRKHEEAGNGFGFKLFTGDDVARTISARYYKDGADILISETGWPRPRKLTPREALMLMGFDDRYARLFGHDKGFPIVVSDVQAYKQSGNAVVPQVVQSVMEQVLIAVKAMGGFQGLENPSKLRGEAPRAKSVRDRDES